MAAGFNSDAFVQILQHHVFDHLDVQDFLQLELVGASAGCVFATGDHWKASVARCWSSITFGDALFEQACRRVLVSCLVSLSGACHSTQCLLQVKDETDARKLTKLIRSARVSADAHMEKGGSSAEVILCQMHKNCVSAPAKDSASATELGHIEFVRTDGGDPMACSLDFQLSCKGQCMLVRAKGFGQDRGHSGANSVLLDLTSASPSVLLHMRSFEVPWDGGWASGKSGLCSFVHGRAAAMDDISRGLTCVLCVRTGGPRKRQTSLAHGLNLDLVRRRSE